MASEIVAGIREKISVRTSVKLVAAPEVEVEQERLEVLQVLDVPGLVEPERLVELLDQLRIRVAAGAQQRRVGRRQQVEDEEDDQRDDEQQQDRPEQPSDDVGQQGGGPGPCPCPLDRMVAHHPAAAQGRATTGWECRCYLSEV